GREPPLDLVGVLNEGAALLEAREEEVVPLEEEADEVAHRLVEAGGLPEESEGAVLDEEEAAEEVRLLPQRQSDDVGEEELLDGRGDVALDATGADLIVDPLVQAE